MEPARRVSGYSGMRALMRDWSMMREMERCASLVSVGLTASGERSVDPALPAPRSYCLVRGTEIAVEVSPRTFVRRGPQ